MTGETTAHNLGKQDLVHSAFETAASNQTNELPMKRSVLLDLATLEGFNGLTIKTPKMHVSTEFMAAVTNTKELALTTLDTSVQAMTARQEHVATMNLG